VITRDKGALVDSATFGSGSSSCGVEGVDFGGEDTVSDRCGWRPLPAVGSIRYIVLISNSSSLVFAHCRAAPASLRIAGASNVFPSESRFSFRVVRGSGRGWESFLRKSAAAFWIISCFSGGAGLRPSTGSDSIEGSAVRGCLVDGASLVRELLLDRPRRENPKRLFFSTI